MDISATELMKALNRVFHTRARISNIILIAALSLSLAGCGVLQPGTMARTTPTPQTDTKDAQELASTTKQPEAPSKPAQPVPPPATASKGTEKLAAPNAPAPVRASERTTLPAEPSVPKAPIAEDSSTVTGAPVEALVFRGPPPDAQPRRVGIKALVWLGLGLGGAALAVLARLYVIRRAKPADFPGPARRSEDATGTPPKGASEPAARGCDG